MRERGKDNTTITQEQTNSSKTCNNTVHSKWCRSVYREHNSPGRFGGCGCGVVEDGEL